ncbi:MAG: hypothetical protein V1779_16640 [bacterium]
MKKFYKILILTIFVFSLFSCEDPIPNDYIEEKFVEAVLIVGEPIQNIVVMRTQSLSEVYNYDSSLVRDAIVKISDGENNFNLVFRNSSYYYPDTNYKVKPETIYELTVNCPDNKILKGTTTTPKVFNWVIPPKKLMYFPSKQDSITLPRVDSLDFEWELVTIFYMISVKCLDTLDYGKYLQPATSELNRRISKRFSNDLRYRELAIWTFIPSNKTPVLWNYFKWYGQHEVAVWNPDKNFLNWGLQYFVDSSYNPRLNSIEGGIGVFGSASVIRDTTFLVKNQP